MCGRTRKEGATKTTKREETPTAPSQTSPGNEPMNCEQPWGGKVKKGNYLSRREAGRKARGLLHLAEIEVMDQWPVERGCRRKRNRSILLRRPGIWNGKKGKRKYTEKESNLNVKKSHTSSEKMSPTT